jgi:hypothetical protein
MLYEIEKICVGNAVTTTMRFNALDAIFPSNWNLNSKIGIIYND